MLDISLWAIIIGILLPTVVFSVQCWAALLPERNPPEDSQQTRPKVAVLVPAYNEASIIGATLETLLPQLTDADRAIAIADNCSDETATIARTFGVTVLERQDLERKGKGYALDYGLKFLEREPPEVVVVIDADCLVHPGTIDKLARSVATLKRPIQATYLMKPPPNANPKALVSALAFMVKNLACPMGLSRLGQPCLLGGTGMAFSWSAIRSVPIDIDHIVEDLQLGVDLAIASHSPLFCPQAKVTGTFPQDKEAVKNQKVRWVHGYLHILLTQIPRLLKESGIQRRFDLLSLALQLCIPPLSLLFTIWSIAIAGVLIMGMMGKISVLAIILAALEGLLIVTSVAAVWAKFGRDDLPVKTLLAVPFYILGQIPIYLSFLVQPQKNWIRTRRDPIEKNSE